MSDPDDASPPTAGLAALSQRVETLQDRQTELRETVESLQAERETLLGLLATKTGLSRRALLSLAGAGGGGAALAALAGGAAASGETWGSATGTIGTDAEPLANANIEDADIRDLEVVRGLVNELVYEDTAVSQATTVSDANVIRYDCSVSGFTITLGSDLETAGGWVVLIDETGNAGSNEMTITANSNIDGGANITVNHDNAITALWYDSSEWRSTRFIDTVDARQGTFEQADINDLAGKGQSNSTQSISNTSTTDVELDESDYEDSDAINVDTTNDKLVVQLAGTFSIAAGVVFAEDLSDGTTYDVTIAINGSGVAKDKDVVGASQNPGSTVAAKERLSANDEITVTVFHDHGSSRNIAGSQTVYLAASREG